MTLIFILITDVFVLALIYFFILKIKLHYFKLNIFRKLIILLLSSVLIKGTAAKLVVPLTFCNLFFNQGKTIEVSIEAR